MDKKLILGIIIVVLVLLTIYFLLGSSTPENMTQSPTMVKNNVSGFTI
ncbi:MAG: hypothetical protein LUQ24_06515 [Methanobacterium sp.]|nr:hypothetical protein [Methanobacterium sp.]